MVKNKPKTEGKLKDEKDERYIEAVGSRKTAAARVRIFNRKGAIIINDRTYSDYFKLPAYQAAVRAPLESLSLIDRISATVKVRGGGLHAQAEAIRNALAKALVKLNSVFKSNLRRAGFLTRDSRMVERKKYGLKKARRAPQWAKR